MKVVRKNFNVELNGTQALTDSVYIQAAQQKQQLSALRELKLCET